MRIQYFYFLLGLLLALGIADCSGVPSRIEQHRAAFEASSPGDRERIRAGDIAVGFTEEMVLIAKGEPSSRDVLPEAGNQRSRWTYTRRALVPMPGNPPASDSAAAPYGYPSPDRPIQTQPSLYGEIPELVVEFENGKVIDWHVPR